MIFLNCPLLKPQFPVQFKTVSCLNIISVQTVALLQNTDRTFEPLQENIQDLAKNI